MSSQATVIAVGLNHETAPLDLRGKLAFAAEHIPQALLALKASLDRTGHEAALLSTCNRTELYLASTDAGIDAQALGDPALHWLSSHAQLRLEALREHAYVKADHAAARHAFRVASGLDSMVLGETQILGQMKSAVRDADTVGTLGTTLHQLFQRSFAVAKEVRSSTDIGAHSISMAAAAVRLAAELFEDLHDVNVLFVGAGEMIELAATHFAARAPKSMSVANRTLERGERLAARLGARALRLSDLPSTLHEYDVVVSCTASSVPIIGLGAVERAIKQRRHRPIFMVDLAVPRDIEPEVAALDDVYLYTIDDLSTMVQTAGEKRQAAVAQAEVIIDAGVQSFAHWLDRRSTVPLIQALRQQTDAWELAEVHRARKRLARGESVDEVIEALARALTQKMMHGTLAELQGADATHREAMASVITRLYLRGSRGGANDDSAFGSLESRWGDDSGRES